MDHSSAQPEKSSDFTDGPYDGETESYSSLGAFSVDGETFTVRKRGSDGSHHYAWVSGPNEGYGFSSSCSDEPVTREMHEAAIRDFLAAIDPETGYL